MGECPSHYLQKIRFKKVKKKIAIIGASYLQLPAVLKAKTLGYEVHCFAWEEGAVCKSIADFFYPISIIEKEKILDVCKQLRIDGITTIASDVAVLAVTYVASKMELIGNPVEYADVTTNKYMMRQNFLNNNVPSPKFAIVDSSGQYDIEGFSYPLIVKPTDRSGSRGVEKVSSPQMLDKAVVRARKEAFSNTAIIEEFVDGKEISVESISFKGKHYILQITDKVTTGDPFFVELEHHQPSSLSEDIKDRVKQIVLKALDALHIEYGASHSELKVTDNGDIRVIEVGARMGGDFIGSDLVQLSTGYDFLGETLKVAMGEFTPPEHLESKFSGVYFLCEETKWLKDIIENKQEHPEIVKAEITDKVLRRVECSGDRNGYLIYKSTNRINYMSGSE